MRIRCRTLTRWALAATTLSVWPRAAATETEHLGLLAPRATKPIVVDARADDWDLTAGIFICGAVETQREDMACWFHAAWDDQALYLLVRWLDATPMSNHGSTAGDHGWNGDSLQVRTIVHEGDEPRELAAHITAWRGSDGLDVVDIAYFGGKLERPQLRDAKQHGAQQAFRANPDGRGYVQELAIPWTLLAEGDFTPVAGTRMTMTVEPNFNTPTNERVTIKDLFRPGEIPDRIFTFMSRRCWGFATFVDAAPATPAPVRLADGRTFPVTMVEGIPAIDWSGLSKSTQFESVVSIPLTIPEGGHVSLNLFDGKGRVVRQLLTNEPLPSGRHDIPWDGLTTPSFVQPGTPVPPGEYRWEALWHAGIGLELVGWAHQSGRSPYASPRGGWGGDQGHPAAVVAAGDRVFLGWSGSESGRAVVAVDLDGDLLWRQKRGGFGNAHHLAVTGDILYVNDRQQGENVVYRLRASDGVYSPWDGGEDAVLSLQDMLAPYVPPGDKEARLTGMDAAAGRLYLAYGAGNVVLALDAGNGKLLGKAVVPAPAALEVDQHGAVHVVSAGAGVLRLTPDLASQQSVVGGLQNAAGIAMDAAGNLYVGIGGETNQVHVFGPDGRVIRQLGRPGGRALLGPWQADGMRFIHALRIDSQNKLWVAEYDDMPRRISAWDAATGTLVREFFGPTNYGAVGGAVCPTDPMIMIGQGCEWRLDSVTGHGACVAVFHRQATAGGPSGAVVNNSRFGLGPDGRLYAAVAGGWYEFSPVFIYERLAEGQWRLRAKLTAHSTGKGHLLKLTGMTVWADENDDALEQPNEVRSFDIDPGGWVNGWYMPMTQSMIFYGGTLRLAPARWTACGAPVYDPTQAKHMPHPDDVAERGGMGAGRGHGSDDGRLVLYNGHYGKEHSDFICYDIESGELRWSYPNTFVGVHGGHKAPPAARGLIRAAYDIAGSIKLPPPLGNIFAIPTDKGEWHLLTERGFYLTHLFQSDPMKRRWPEEPAKPGVRVDDTPPGGGAEDFGGSITLTTDGQVHLQAGQTAFVNLKILGLESVKTLADGALVFTAENQLQAEAARGRLLQATVGDKRVAIPAGNVEFGGNLEQDFGRPPLLRFGTPGSSGIAVAAAWGKDTLFLGWEVEDATPWVNGATEAANLYACGDTVDFQLGTNPDADPARRDPVAGDFRLSVGNLQGKPTAVLYRPVSAVKQPRTFFSGVARDGYTMDYVGTVDAARLKVVVDAGRRRYVVQAAIPLAALGLAPTPGLALRGDFGVTFGNETGDDTALRVHWSNQATGIVADEVYELMLQPANWGTIQFE